MKFNLYIVKFTIDKYNKGAAIIIAESMEKAASLLKTQGKFNGTGYNYNIGEILLVSDTNQYNFETIIEEIAYFIP